MRTVIRPGALIDGTGAPGLEAPAVVIEDGRIAWVGRASDLPEEVSGAETVLAPSQTLVPGLIDAHVHLMCWGEPTTSQEYLRTSDGRLLLTALANAQAGLQAGVTTMRDVGSRDFLVTELRDSIDAGRLIGPRILVAGPVITTTGGHFYYFGREADSVDQVVAAVRALCKGGVDLVKVMATGGGSTPGTNPQQAQYGVEQLRALVDDAHRLGRRVAAHAHGVPGIRNAVDAGVDTIEHCSWLGPTGVEYDGAIAERIAAKGIYVSLALTARYRLPAGATLSGMTADQRRTMALRESRFDTIRKMVALGANVVASSDSGMLLTRTSDFAGVLELMVRELRLSPLDAIRAATETAARSLGIADEVGTISKGKRADLVLLDGNPLADMASLRKVTRVFRDGKTVALNGMLVPPDIAR